MTQITRSFALYASLLLISTFCVQRTLAQSVIDPADPVINYTSAMQPQPKSGWHEMKKWVRTPNANVQSRNGGWTASNYKCYNYDGMAFRVRFPKNYSTSNDGKKYPLIVFLHGKGEVAKLTNGENYDNEFQLLQGPYEFEQAILNDKWNGYVIAPQVTDLFYQGDLERIMAIVDYMITNNKVDPFGIIGDGLSSGGLATWQIFNSYPLYFSSVTPISGPVQLDFGLWPYGQSYVSNKKYTPVWITQGELDTNPEPGVTKQLQDSFLFYGANFKRSVYHTDGHGTWYHFWGEGNFWPFINRSYKSNPWPLYGKNKFWTGQPITPITIGVMPGFGAYQWRYNNSLIGGATSNEINVTGLGTYDARVQWNGQWSDWSHVPVTVTQSNTFRFQAEDWWDMDGLASAGSNRGVQTESTPDLDGGSNINVGWIDRGDWMDYTLNPAPYFAGNYTLKLRVATPNNGAQLQIKGMDSAVLATVNLPNTGNYQNWTTVTVPNITLKAGAQRIRIVSTANPNWNINWFELTQPAQAPLPVKFVYFNSQCKGNSVALQWKTSQEQDTKDFSIQRSTDGISWSDIGTVAAAGQSNQEQSYTFVDRSPGSSSLYRIVENDNSGRYTISSIVRSSCSSVRNEISVYPNPSSGNSSLNINLERSTKVNVRIVDSKGAVMQQSQVQLPSGNTTLPLNLSNYAKGVYTIDVRYANEVKSMKLIKD